LHPPPPVHAIGEQQDLIEITAVHHHRGAGIPRRAQGLLYGRRGLEVEPARRIFYHQCVRLVGQFTPQHILLLIPARQRACDGVRSGGAHVEAREQRGCTLAQRRPRHASAPCTGATQCRVLEERRVEQQCVAVTILGHEANTLRAPDFSLGGLEPTGQQAKQLVLSRPFHRGDPHDFTGVHGHRRAPHAQHAAFVAPHGLACRQHRIARRRCRGTHRLSGGCREDLRGTVGITTRRHRRRADHGAGERILRGVARARGEYGAPTVQHRDVIGHREGVAQFVRDQHDGVAGIGMASYPGQQLRGFCRGEHRRGFVENEQLHVARECLHDFAALLRTHRQRAHACLRIELQPGMRRHIHDGLGGTCRIECAMATEGDVLRDRHGGHQGEMLVHHPNAVGEGLRRAREAYGVALPAYRAGVGGEEAEHHAHQCSLAGAILTEEGVHGAATHGEVRAVERAHAAEGVRDLFEREQRGAVRRRSRRWWSHEPVGRCRKVQGTPNFASIHAPSACTPSVSVA